MIGLALNVAAFLFLPFIAVMATIVLFIILKLVFYAIRGSWEATVRDWKHPWARS